MIGSMVCRFIIVKALAFESLYSVLKPKLNSLLVNTNSV